MPLDRQVCSTALKPPRPPLSRRQEARIALEVRQAEQSRLEEEGRGLDASVRDAAARLEVPPRHNSCAARLARNNLHDDCGG